MKKCIAAVAITLATATFSAQAQQTVESNELGTLFGNQTVQHLNTQSMDEIRGSARGTVELRVRSVIFDPFAYVAPKPRPKIPYTIPVATRYP